MRFASVMLGLSGILAGCAGVPTTQVIKAVPPEYLLQDCEVPAIRFNTNGDLVDAIVAFRGALRVCNNDKEALREWAKQP